GREAVGVRVSPLAPGLTAEMGFAHLELDRFQRILPPIVHAEMAPVPCQPGLRCERVSLRARAQTVDDTRVEIPETRYATTPDGGDMGCEGIGDGAVDLVFVPPWVSDVEIQWEEPRFARFLRGLASFSRLITFDKRGTGLSDRVSDDRLPDMETRMDDVRAVLDQVGSERAALFGVFDGGHMSMVFAATYPERTLALILLGAPAKARRSSDYPWGLPEDWIIQDM